MNHGDKITLKKGTKVGAGSLKYDVIGHIVRVEKREDGSEFYGVKFIDKKNRERITWIS